MLTTTVIIKGTCPGLNFVYAHTNYLITKHETDGDIPEFMFLTGVSSSLFGTLKLLIGNKHSSPVMVHPPCYPLCSWKVQSQGMSGHYQVSTM